MNLVKKLTVQKSVVLFLVAGLIFLSATPLFALTKRGRDKEIGVVLNLSALVREDGKQTDVDGLVEAKKGFLNILGEAFGKHLVEIKTTGVTAGEFVKNPNALLFEGARNDLDHVLEFTGTLRLSDVDKGKKSTDFSYDLQGKVRVIDVATLKIAGEEELKISDSATAENKTGDTSLLVGPYETVALAILPKMKFYNPNLMEKMSLRQVADYFFNKDQCERAGPLYEKALKSPYDFDILDEMNRRVQHCKDVVGKLSRLQAKFRLNLEFEAVSETYQAPFKNTAARMRLAETLNKYTDKPVLIKIRYIGEKSGGAPGEILMSLVYDPARFRVAEISKAGDSRGFVDLSPFNGPIAELARFKAAGVQGLNEARRALFAQFSMQLKLENFNGDSATYLVDIGSNNRIMAPKSIDFQVHGFKPFTAEQEDESGRDKNQFILGPAFTVEGKPTTNNVVYQFFGVKTK